MGGFSSFQNRIQQLQGGMPNNLQPQQSAQSGVEATVPPGTGGIKPAPGAQGQMQGAPVEQMQQPQQAYTGGGGKGGMSQGQPGGYGGGMSQGAWAPQGYGGMPGRYSGGNFGGYQGGGYGGAYGGGGYGQGGFARGNMYGPGSYGGYPGSMGYGGGSGMMGGGPFGGGYNFNQGAMQSAGLGGYGGYTGGGGKGGMGSPGGQYQAFNPMDKVNADYKAREAALAQREQAAAQAEARRKRDADRIRRQQDHKCFIEGTMIKLADGRNLPIEQVKIGDTLHAHGGDLATVIGLDRPKLGDRLLYSINKGPHFVSQDHPFYTPTGWKSFDPDRTNDTNRFLEAEQLQIGDEILTFDGFQKVEFISVTGGHPQTQLYNFKLSGDPTYFADGYLVHTEQ